MSSSRFRPASPGTGVEGGPRKRARLSESSAPPSEESVSVSKAVRHNLQQLEQNAQRQVAQKIEAIVRREFTRALGQKEDELERIDERILATQKALHLVRFGAVHDFYASSVAKPSLSAPEVVAIHPALRPMIGGKRPPTSNVATTASQAPPTPSTANADPTQLRPEPVAASLSPVAAKTRSEDRMPGYVPPLSSDPVVVDPRGAHLKLKRRIIVGNVSKWIQCDQREDMATHKWMIYVRGDKNQADISDIVAKVRFLIHPSYHPHDLIETTQPPFHLTRRGWGEFPARIQIHFKHPLDKPVDIIHNLRLDKTYTGLQTLGAETNVDLWLHNPAVQDKPDETTPPKDEPKMVPTSEGWVIAHSECRDLRDILPVPAEEETAGQIQVPVPKMPNKSRSKHRDAKNAQTTFIRCTGKDGKTIFLPVTFLPDNHRKKVPGVSSTLTTNLGSPPATRLLPSNQVVSTNHRLDASLLTKIEVEHKSPSSPNLFNGNQAASPSGLLKPLAASNTPDRSSPRVSPCASPVPNTNNGLMRVTNGVSLLNSSHHRRTGTSSANTSSSNGSSVLPGTSLLKRSATLLPPPLSLPRVEPPSATKVPLPQWPASSLSELERAIPNVSLETWKRVLGYAPGEVQLDVELRIGKPGGPTLRKYLDWLQFLSDKAFTLKSSDFPSLESCLVYLARFLPLVTPLAKNAVYKCIHPYSSESVKEFLSWSKPRQKASEWQRAKMLFRILENVPLLEPFSRSTSTKQIIQVLRSYGFHVPNKTIDYQINQLKDLPTTISQVPRSLSCPDNKSQKRESTHPSSEVTQTEELIDVVGSDSESDQHVVSGKTKEETRSSSAHQPPNDLGDTNDSHAPKRACLWLPEDDVSAMTFVKDKAREVGVDLVEEEIAPRILYQATQKLVLRACKFLCESLIRKGHKAAYDRLGGPPTEVSMVDVLEAIKNDPLLSICSNAGLGKPPSSLKGSLSSESTSTSRTPHPSLITPDIKKEPM